MAGKQCHKTQDVLTDDSKLHHSSVMCCSDQTKGQNGTLP